jgi:hypothetical protein
MTMGEWFRMMPKKALVILNLFQDNEMPSRVILSLFQDNAARHFFRPKSTLTTLEPSSTTEGPSLPASSCGSGALSPASTWNCNAKSTAGSTKAVIAE